LPQILGDHEQHGRLEAGRDVCPGSIERLIITPSMGE
jgi:hypothetical protein